MHAVDLSDCTVNRFQGLFNTSEWLILKMDTASKQCLYTRAYVALFS